MTGWFSVPVFIITLSGLFAGGLIFNFLNEKSNNIYTSWFVHMFANFAINIIGFMLFGII
jgi:ABC-type xylose transport system permease subunit